MNGYFLMADILGFSHIVTNDAIDVHERIAQWTALVDECAAEHDIAQVQLISDTLFAACPSAPREFLNLVRFSRDLLDKGIHRSLPVRGAIGHGDYTWGRLTYGDTVIRCHQAEQNQTWMGIACLPDVPVPDEARDLGLVTLYPPPCRSGPIVLTYVVLWDPPGLQDLIKLVSDGGLAQQGKPLPQEWLTKVHSTLMFKYYQKVKRDLGAPEWRFFGLTPLQLIEFQLYGTPMMYVQKGEQPGPGELPKAPPSATS